MAATVHQFGCGQFAGLRSRFQAANRDGIGELPADGRVSMQFPADIADFQAVAWLVMGDGTLPDDQWTDVDLGWLLTVLLSEGMDTVTAVRVVLEDPGNLSHTERDRYARVRAHVAALFNQPHLGTSRAVGRATKQAIGRAVDRAGLAGAGGAGPVLDLDALAGVR